MYIQHIFIFSYIGITYGGLHRSHEDYGKFLEMMLIKTGGPHSWAEAPIVVGYHNLFDRAGLIVTDREHDAVGVMWIEPDGDQKRRKTVFLSNAAQHFLLLDCKTDQNWHTPETVMVYYT